MKYKVGDILRELDNGRLYEVVEVYGKSKVRLMDIKIGIPFEGFDSVEYIGRNFTLVTPLEKAML